MEGAGTTTSADAGQSLTQVFVLLAMTTDTSAHAGLQRNSVNPSGISMSIQCAGTVQPGLLVQETYQRRKNPTALTFIVTHRNKVKTDPSRTCSTSRDVQWCRRRGNLLDGHKRYHNRFGEVQKREKEEEKLLRMYEAKGDPTNQDPFGSPQRCGQDLAYIPLVA
ncbi:uncharacterized protein UTRI_02799 [Ustilago trichophora]|uniref:Uncharacterized protein n=1 Tax=Ustilago trichophora TaxID=86804 RepID=A0A5C3EP64_9BASI|nr:uncharacterized protein UTRI_02799 [Ustilago trichophora]